MTLPPEKELVGDDWVVRLDPPAVLQVRCATEAVADALIAAANAGGRFRLTMDAELNAPEGVLPPLLLSIEAV